MNAGAADSRGWRDEPGFWASWRILRSALRILLQGTPEGFDLEAAIGALRSIEGVEDVHHVHLKRRFEVYLSTIQVEEACLAGEEQAAEDAEAEAGRTAAGRRAA